MAKCNLCGQKGAFLKLNADGLCVECVTKKLEDAQTKIDALNARITPELIDAETIQKTLKARQKELESLDSSIVDATKLSLELKARVDSLNSQVLFVSDAIELESFALYTPRYEFVNSDEYKTQLDAIRNDQKRMLKDKVAVIYDTNWTVNGSKTVGKQLLADMEKLFIRSFNNECDAAVSDVKFSNFDRCKERIMKAFDTINKLGRVNKMSLSFQYRQSKLDELSLAYEYQCKKQEEKEQLRALREQQREEAKLAKEIEAARKEAEKEKKHYQQALEKLKVQYAACRTDEEKAALVEKQNELIGYLDDISAKLEDIDYRQANQRAGYVYIISNIGSFGEGIYKIGMTRRLDPMERVYELGDASVPFMFDVHAMIFSDDAPKLEAALHQAFADRRVNMVNNRREYFRVSLAEIKKVVLANHDKTVEFVESPEAQQYRETMLIKSASSVDLQQAKGA